MSNEIVIHEFTLPFGPMRLGSLGDELCLATWLTGTKPNRPLSKIAAECHAQVRAGMTPVIMRAIDEFEMWCAGESRTFDLPLYIHGTDFQKVVWDGLQKINYAEMVTYSVLSTRIGRRSAIRAVAGACGANPLHVIIPCHRVIGKGDLGGFAGGQDLKLRLLRHEYEVDQKPSGLPIF